MDEKPVSKTKSINIISQTKQYGLNNICLDPFQNSPPSLWKMRLNKRFGDSPIKNNNSLLLIK
jgi:hypothetical protein